MKFKLRFSPPNIASNTTIQLCSGAILAAALASGVTYYVAGKFNQTDVTPNLNTNATITPSKIVAANQSSPPATPAAISRPNAHLTPSSLTPTPDPCAESGINDLISTFNAYVSTMTNIDNNGITESISYYDQKKKLNPADYVTINIQETQDLDSQIDKHNSLIFQFASHTNSLLINNHCYTRKVSYTLMSYPPTPTALVVTPTPTASSSTN